MTNPTHARFDRNQTHARDERSRLVLGTMRRVTKNVAKGRYKVGLLEGLSQDLQLLTPQIVTVHELFCVSRRQQHLDAGLELPRAVGTMASLPRRISAPWDRRWLRHLIADHFQPPDGELAHTLVIFRPQVWFHGHEDRRHV